MEILHHHKDKFGTDFLENKKALNTISIIRSKELKNELAGYITRFIKHEIREREEKEQQAKKENEVTSDSIDPTPEKKEENIISQTDNLSEGEAIKTSN